MIILLIKRRRHDFVMPRRSISSDLMPVFCFLYFWWARNEFIPYGRLRGYGMFGKTQMAFYHLLVKLEKSIQRNFCDVHPSRITMEPKIKNDIKEYLYRKRKRESNKWYRLGMYIALSYVAYIYPNAQTLTHLIRKLVDSESLFVWIRDMGLALDTWNLSNVNIAMKRKKCYFNPIDDYMFNTTERT